MELKELLRQWESPKPGKNLDVRVMSSWRKSKPGPRLRTWLGVAAGILLLLGLAQSVMTPRTTRLATTMDVHGFRPVPDGNITVTTVSKGSKE